MRPARRSCWVRSWARLLPRPCLVCGTFTCLPLCGSLGCGPALRDLSTHADVDRLRRHALAAELGRHRRTALGVRSPLVAGGVGLGASLCGLLRGSLRSVDLCRLPAELRLCAGVLGELTGLVGAAVRRAAGVGLGVVLARLELELGGAVGAAGVDVSIRLGGDRLAVVTL
ncbi:hypothetical protein C5C13_13530 [Clavibacter michiganensis]|nr:hypothetical protein C5C13_13530 [Clavibacter michiganensis]